jgi:hypothetical protein
LERSLMPFKTHSYSVRFFGDDGYVMQSDNLSAAKKREFQSIAKKMFRNYSVRGLAAAYQVIAFVEDGDVVRPSDVELLYNDQVSSPAMKKKAVASLTSFGFDLNGYPLRKSPPAFSNKRKASGLKLATKKKARRLPQPRTVESALDAVRKKKPVRPCNPNFMTPGFAYTTTPGARKHVPQREGMAAVERFRVCDWGDVSRGQASTNNRLSRGGKGPELMRASYRTRTNVEFWLVCDPREKLITILLPEEN